MASSLERLLIVVCCIADIAVSPCFASFLHCQVQKWRKAATAVLGVHGSCRKACCFPAHKLG
eukprot:14773371-Ditylum_brightwellii.AAC.1